MRSTIPRSGGRARRSSLRGWLVLAGGLAVAAAAVAAAQDQAPPEPGTPRPFALPEGSGFALANGLEATLVPYGQIPKATVRLVLRVGNVNEQPDEIWLTDLMGDLMEEGTESRDAQQLAADVAGMGGSFGVTVGADQTQVGGNVLAEFAPDMVRLVAEVVRAPRFPAEELPRLQASRVRDLSIARSQPQSLAQERFRQVLYPDHPYGRLFPEPAMVQGYTVEQVRAFYDARVGAAGARLYVTGRFDAQSVETAIREAFGDWPSGAAEDAPAPRPTSRRAVHLIDRPGAVQSTVYIGLPIIDPSHDDWVALQVTNALLGGAFSSRITANIREDKGYTYSPFSTLSARYRDAFWAQIADVTTDVTGASLEEIFYEIDRLQAEPPSADELRGIQNYLSGTFVLQNSSRAGIINQLSFADLHGLGRGYLERYVQRVHAVTVEDVQRIAKTYLDAGTMTIVIVGDRSAIEDQVRAYGELTT